VAGIVGAVVSLTVIEATPVLVRVEDDEELLPVVDVPEEEVVPEGDSELPLLSIG
jgi:hypothetical protein